MPDNETYTSMLRRIVSFVSSRLGAAAKDRKIYLPSGVLDWKALGALFLEAADIGETDPVAFMKDILSGVRSGETPQEGPSLSACLREADFLDSLLSKPHMKDTPEGPFIGSYPDRPTAETWRDYLRRHLFVAAAYRWLDGNGDC